MKKRYNNNNKIKITVYVIIRALVVAVMISEIIDRDLNNIMICALTLILLMLPDMLERRLRIKLPTALEVMIVLFIFAAEILGEIHGFYVMFPEWDDMLHTINGFLAAAVGVAMIDILNRSEKVKFQLTPLSVALAAFSFSMTIGVLWEFFECIMDTYFGKDMQKDTWVSAFNSVALDPSGENTPVHVDVESVSVNDMKWDKYLDIGLYDTMHDLFVNFVGAAIFSVIGFFYVKNRGHGIAAEFIPTMDEERENEDEKLI